jgi:hypothetical protein
MDYNNKTFITYDWLAQNHSSWVPICNNFSADALRPSGIIEVLGQYRKAELFICIEWDYKTICVGYNGGVSEYTRELTGLEESFPAYLITQGKFTESNTAYLDDRETLYRLQHDMILTAIQEGQRILENSQQIDNVVKETIRRVIFPLGQLSIPMSSKNH